MLATLVGLAMVGGGIYGLIQGDDDDDSASASETTSFSSFPTTPTSTDPGAPDPCLQARARDLRLGLIDGLGLEPSGGETGSAKINAVCNGETVVLFFRMQGMRRQEPTSYFVWLYKSRRKAKQIGSLIGSDGRANGSATIQPNVDTEDYDQIVVTRVKFGVGEKRPRKIVFSGDL